MLYLKKYFDKTSHRQIESASDNLLYYCNILMFNIKYL